MDLSCLNSIIKLIQTWNRFSPKCKQVWKVLVISSVLQFGRCFIQNLEEGTFFKVFLTQCAIKLFLSVQSVKLVFKIILCKYLLVVYTPYFCLKYVWTIFYKINLSFIWNYRNLNSSLFFNNWRVSFNLF